MTKPRQATDDERAFVIRILTQTRTGVCLAGRRIRRDDRYGGLDWSTPCLDAADDEYTLDLGRGVVELCTAHGAVIHDELYARYVELGLINPADCPH